MQKDCFFRFVSAVVLVHISWVSGTDTFDEARKLEEARKELEEASQELEEASRALDAEAWKEAREALEAKGSVERSIKETVGQLAERNKAILES